MSVDMQPNSALVSRSNTLVRITKKVTVPFLDVNNMDDKNSTRSWRNTPVELSNGVMKKMLGKLYTDKKYLQELKETISNKSNFADSQIAALADSGLKFLQERGEYWDKLGPLPPLVIKPKRNPRRHEAFKISTDSLISQTTHNVYKLNNSSGNSRTKAREIPVDPNELLQFKFLSYRPATRQEVETQEIVEQSDREDISTENIEAEEEKRRKIEEVCKKELTEYFNQIIQDIEKEFDKEYFESCEQLSMAFLEQLDHFQDDSLDVICKARLKLYNILGNICIERDNLAVSMEYFHKALSFKTTNDDEFLTLGNIGRVLTLQGQHNQALQTFTQQARLSSSNEDSAKVFLSLGNCFLSLGQYVYAKDCGRKSLKASQRADDKKIKIEATILLAVTLAHLNKPKDASRKLAKAQQMVTETGHRVLKLKVTSAEEHIKHISKSCNVTKVKEAERNPTRKIVLPKLNLNLVSLISTRA